jgi:hypothetical protein
VGSEGKPVILRDESGRFILTFESDRNAQHNHRLHLCWSRDFVHWSSPALIIDKGISRYDVIQDSRGRLLLALSTENETRVLASKDLYPWEKLATLPLPGKARDISLLQREDGTYELVTIHQAGRPRTRQGERPGGRRPSARPRRGGPRGGMKAVALVRPGTSVQRLCASGGGVGQRSWIIAL